MSPITLPLYKSWSPPLKRGEGRNPYNEPLTRPIIYLTDQWAVTGYGLEARHGRYAIKAEQLTSHDGPNGNGYLWEWHMGGKKWVDLADFRVALAIAIDYHIRQPRMAKLWTKYQQTQRERADWQQHLNGETQKEEKP